MCEIECAFYTSTNARNHPTEALRTTNGRRQQGMDEAWTTSTRQEQRHAAPHIRGGPTHTRARRIRRGRGLERDTHEDTEGRNPVHEGTACSTHATSPTPVTWPGVSSRGRRLGASRIQACMRRLNRGLQRWNAPGEKAPSRSLGYREQPLTSMRAEVDASWHRRAP